MPCGARSRAPPLSKPDELYFGAGVTGAGDGFAEAGGGAVAGLMLNSSISNTSIEPGGITGVGGRIS
jgi:hypothetical protein